MQPTKLNMMKVVTKDLNWRVSGYIYSLSGCDPKYILVKMIHGLDHLIVLCFIL